MRISDWSSDVCSSDLRPAAADDAADAGVPDPGVDPRSEHRVRRGDPARRHQPADRPAPLAARAAAGQGAAGRPPAAGADRRDGLGAAAGADQPAAPRSEEHTSELQSLMRISYAVFCLKKKKQTSV